MRYDPLYLRELQPSEPGINPFENRLVCVCNKYCSTIIYMLYDHFWILPTKIFNSIHEKSYRQSCTQHNDRSLSFCIEREKERERIEESENGKEWEQKRGRIHRENKRCSILQLYWLIYSTSGAVIIFYFVCGQNALQSEIRMRRTTRVIKSAIYSSHKWVLSVSGFSF